VVIGSNRQKAICLRHGLLPKILSFVGDESAQLEIRREACVVLGSLVKGTPENVRAVVDACSVPILIGGLITYYLYKVKCLIIYFFFDSFYNK
jgi:hypothetical protein